MVKYFYRFTSDKESYYVVTDMGLCTACTNSLMRLKQQTGYNLYYNSFLYHLRKMREQVHRR